MSFEMIKQKIATSEYDFLRTNPHLGNNIMLLTWGGSYSYGTNVDTPDHVSDIDLRGISYNTEKDLLGLSNFEQFENSDTDTVIYGFKKILTLLSNCNPNTIELLGNAKDKYFILSEGGELLLNNRDLFLSKKAIYSFGGYATAQLRRLQNALVRDNYPQGEKEEHILNTVLSQMEHFRDKYAEFTNEQINIYIDKSEKEDYEKELFIDIYNLEHYPLRDFKNIYSEMSNVIDEYGKLNHRNRKKDEIHLNKHAMHLIRLFLMGTEILSGNGINTYRTKDQQLLLDIRNGKYVTKKVDGSDDYTTIFELVNKYEKEFNYAAKYTILPDKPDYNKIEELAITINKISLDK